VAWARPNNSLAPAKLCSCIVATLIQLISCEKLYSSLTWAIVAGDNLWCIDSNCCASSYTGVWSCYGPEDQCCDTGYTCPSGSQCYLDSVGDQWCLEGSNTVSAATGAAPQTSSSSAPSTETTGRSGASTTTTAPTTTKPVAPASTSTHSGAGTVGRPVDALAKIVQLVGAAAILL